MSLDTEISKEAVTKADAQLRAEAEATGYHLNPDKSFTEGITRGLLKNEQRYGYRSCPCRLASGNKGKDLDIICPCDYRDPDVTEFGACYCGLYVSDEIYKGLKKVEPVPERRFHKSILTITENKKITDLKYPVWRCKVCGYLCARETPPDICPICKVKKDRFERFL